MPRDLVEQVGEPLVDDIVGTHDVGHRVGHELEGMLGVDALAGLVVDDPERAVGEAHEGVAGAGVAVGRREDLELGGHDLGPRGRLPGEVLAQARCDLRRVPRSGSGPGRRRRGRRCPGEAARSRSAVAAARSSLRTSWTSTVVPRARRSLSVGPVVDGVLDDLADGPLMEAEGQPGHAAAGS